MTLYHYYDKKTGPFRLLSDLSLVEAKAVLADIRNTKPDSQAATRDPLYVEHWRNCEAILRHECEKKVFLSFTYADSMPAFSPTIHDGKEYRHKLYTYEEILKVIEKYGLPQDWNDDGKYGPERYIEVQIWSDETIQKYRKG